MNIAIVLVHNKGDIENAAQIETLKPLITKITDTNDAYDEDGKLVGTFDTYHYEIQGLPFPHEARFYQIFPYGVTPPANKDDIDSHKVYYGKGDEDKTGDHPRFFNWGLKRATDYGAEAVVHIEDVNKLNLDDLAVYLNSLVDPNDKHEFADDTGIKVSSLTLLKEVGQVDESSSLDQAISDLKTRVVEGGLKNG